MKKKSPPACNCSHTFAVVMETTTSAVLFTCSSCSFSRSFIAVVENIH